MVNPATPATKYHELTPVNGASVPAVVEFFKVPKGKRGKNTLKGDNGDLSKTVYTIPVGGNSVWYVSVHILPVEDDALFAGFKHLKRGHCVVLAVLVDGSEAVVTKLWDAGSLDKFANLNQDPEAYPKATEKYLNSLDCPATLEIKYSGSHIVWVTLPEFIEGRTDRTESERIPNPFATFFMSKNGYNNDYSRAGEQAVRKHLGCLDGPIPRPAVTTDNEVTVISFELMTLDEHVYQHKGEDLYVIQVATKARNDSEYVVWDRASAGLPVVETVGTFENPRDAIKYYERLDQSENNENGCEGFILTVKTDTGILRIKVKLGDYLTRRRFRWDVEGSGYVAPRCESFMENVKQWGYPISDDRKEWWFARLEQWWWWLRSSLCPAETFLDVSTRKKYIGHRDWFLANWQTIPSTRELIADVIENKKTPVICVLMLSGVPGSGKDYICDNHLAPLFPGWLRSQDQCGSDRSTYAADFGRFAIGLPAGLHWAIANRGNWGARDRATLAWEFGKVANGSLIKIINVAIDWRGDDSDTDSDTDSDNVDRNFFNLCMRRIRDRTGHPNLTVDAIGAIEVGVVVRRTMRDSSVPADAIRVAVDYIDEDFIFREVASRVPAVLGIDITHNLPPLQPKAPVKKATKVVKYRGVACFDGHITLQFGSSAVDAATEAILNVPEGTEIDYTEIGRYREDGKIEGLLVDIGDGLVRHITTWTAPDVKPAYSNELISRVFGCAVDDKPSVTNKIVDDHVVWYDTPVSRVGFVGSMKM